LRCNRCEKPICVSCAVQTPTGYRCRECIRGQQKVFNTAIPTDYVFSILIAGILAFIGSYVVTFIGFFTLLLAPIIGTLIATAVRRAVNKRRSRQLYLWTTAAAVLGSLPILIFMLLGSGFLSILWQGFYTFLMASTLYYRMSGIQITRK
jgi:uncharacterized membrane protein YeaQ/YmgE (transglycosylase-associated protein family)